MPTTLQVRRRSSGTPDAHGNAAGVLGDPEDWVVSGIAPGAMAEPGRPDRDLSVIAWTVYAADSPGVPTERDVVIVDGIEHPVDGRPADWTRGPWANPAAGVVVELRRVEG